MNTFSLFKCVFTSCMLVAWINSCLLEVVEANSQLTTPHQRFKTPPTKSKLATNQDKTSQPFIEWGCINQRTVNVMLLTAQPKSQGGEIFNVTSQNVSTIAECSSSCPNIFDYMFFQEKNSGKEENCHCLATITTNDLFKFRAYPSDLEASEVVNLELKCEKKTSFLLSCRNDAESGCVKLKEGLQKDPLFDKEAYIFPSSNFFPKCLSHNDIDITGLTDPQEIIDGAIDDSSMGSQNVRDQCTHYCGVNRTTTYSVITNMDQEGHIQCRCGNKTTVNSKQEFIIRNDCDKLDSVFTIGNKNETRYSVYCSKDKSGVFLNRNCNKYSNQEETNDKKSEFTYFGCVRKPKGMQNSTQTPISCIENCKKKDKDITLLKYMNDTHVNCLCLPQTMQFTTRNISTGCEETWCQDLGGPCGSTQNLHKAEDGYSLYCKMSYDQNGIITQNGCKQLADPANFYSFCYSPCPATTDKRGNYWNQTCSGDRLEFEDYCPENTIGTASWSCDNGNWVPEQPDRTNCIAEWVDDVVEQAQHENSSAVNITSIILNHTSNPSVEITSGTLIRLIQLGLNLSSSCNWDRIDADNDGQSENNTSLLITRNYVQITSDLFSRTLSWEEIHPHDKTKHANDLMNSMEGIAYRHMHGVSNATNSTYLLIPIYDKIEDHRNQVTIYMTVMSKDQKITPSMIPPQISLPSNMGFSPHKDSLLHTSLFGATYNFPILKNTLMSADHFSNYNDHGQTLKINSVPVMVSLSINNNKLYHFKNGPATVTFQHENASVACPGCERWCVFWNETSQEWSDHGMAVKKTTAHETVCTTDHLTSFSVIFDFSGVEFSNIEREVLEILSLVFCSASCLCALLTLIILNISRLPASPRITIVKHRAFCLFMLYILFLVGLDPNTLIVHLGSKVSELCTAAGIAIQYFGLTVFAWTLLEGHHLYNTLQATRFDSDGRYTMLVRYVFGYFGPLAVLALTLAVGTITKKGPFTRKITELYNTVFNLSKEPEYGVCFLSMDTFIWFFIIPAGLMILFNMVVFAKALKAVKAVKKNRNVSSVTSTFIQIKSWFMLTFLLGITWATGFIFNIPNMKDVAFAFVILNGSSGIFIFVHTIILNEPIMTEMKVLLGFLDKDSFGINHGVDRKQAFKSFKAPVDRKLKKNDSTSSEEVRPKVTRRPPRKKKSRTYEEDNMGPRRNQNWVVDYNPRGSRMHNSSVSQPEDTSINSTFSSSSSRTSRESEIYQSQAYFDEKKVSRRQVEGERRVDRFMAALPEDRVLQEQRRIGHRHSNKW